MACVVGSGCGTATADIAKKLGWLLSPHPPPPNTNITLPVYTHKTSPLDPTCSCVCFCESVNPPAAPLMPDPVCLHTQS